MRNLILFLFVFLMACGGSENKAAGDGNADTLIASDSVDESDAKDSTEPGDLDDSKDNDSGLTTPDVVDNDLLVGDDVDAGAEDPCDLCPEGAICHTNEAGVNTCYQSAQIVEEFDNQEHMEESTTAKWGGGSLSLNTGDLGGSGKDGAFLAQEDMVIDTGVGATFEYSTFVIEKGVTVTVKGPEPLYLRVQGDVQINGKIVSNGVQGKHVCKKPDGSGGAEGGKELTGGQGGAGGGAGGNGGAGFESDGHSGLGLGGGAPSLSLNVGFTILGAAGGGSFGSLGGDGNGKQLDANGVAGPVYGDEFIATLQGGAGGGGGAGRDLGGNDDSCDPSCEPGKNCKDTVCGPNSTYQGDGELNKWDRPGASGGGGGGGIGIDSGGSILIKGLISVNGGNGGWGEFSGAAGGGSGGAIRLRAWNEVTLIGGTLSAIGGKGGRLTCSNQLKDQKAGDGGDGRIRVASKSGMVTGYLLNPSPSPSYGTPVGVIQSGSGKDGDFKATEDTVLNTDDGPFEFKSFVLPEGVTLTAEGKNPLEIYSQTAIEVYGTIDLSGQKGGAGYSACCGNPYEAAHAGLGGKGTAGGFDGGKGGEAASGAPGLGPGGSPGGPVGPFSSAGGGGFASVGQSGGTNSCKKEGPLGGQAYGAPQLTDLIGGSGGGGAGDGHSGACTWCEAGKCIYTNLSNQCPANKCVSSYCAESVKSACSGVVECTPTDRWNPGSGGGAGGGAMRLQAAAMVRLDGQIRLNGGDAGDSYGAGIFNDGSCGPDCEKGCLNGVCAFKGGGSFGGSGGGGSGGALLVLTPALRANGFLEALGGKSGALSQGGGCSTDPDAENPLPGQARGGIGSVGRIRVETLAPTGSVVIGDGSFSRGKMDQVVGGFAQSSWYSMEHSQALLVSVVAQGLSSEGSLLVQTTTADENGLPMEQDLTSWNSNPGVLPSGMYVRFRVELGTLAETLEVNGIESVQIDYMTPLD